jgi:hypothetical protein
MTETPSFKSKAVALGVLLQIILSSLQRSKISPDRELHPESEQFVRNEASTVAVMSRKLRILGSRTWRRRGTQVGRLGGEAHVCHYLSIGRQEE